MRMKEIYREIFLISLFDKMDCFVDFFIPFPETILGDNCKTHITLKLDF